MNESKPIKEIPLPPEKARFYDKKEFQRIFEIKNLFDRNIALEQFAAEAEAAGVKGTKARFAAFAKDNKGGKLFASNMTSFEGQQFELSCGEWQADDMGITREGAFGEEIVACVHPIMPTLRLTNIDTGLEKMTLAFKRGGRWQSTAVPKSVIASANKIIDLADHGIAVTSENAKYLVKYLHDIEAYNYEEMPCATTVSRLGHVHGEFVPYSEGLIYDGDASFRSLYNAVKSPRGSLDVWADCMRGLRRESLPAKILLAASFASALIEPLGLLPFFVHIWGSAGGTGKTVGLMMAASVWGDPAIGRYVQTFNSTVVGMERLAAFLNSMPVVIDELQLAEVDGRGDKAFNVYRLAEGVGKNRGAKNGGKETTPTWFNTILTSGETPILNDRSAAGAMLRVIEIEVSAGTKVVKDGHAVAGVVRQNYGLAGKFFVEGMDYDRARLIYEAAYNQFVEVAEDKQAHSAACLLTADALATELIFKDGQALTASELSVYLKSSADVDVNAKAYSFIKDWVVQNSKAFDRNFANAQVYGIFDAPNPLTDETERVYIIKKVFRDTLQAAGFSYKSVQAWLADKGLLQMKGKNYTTTKVIGGVKADCYCVTLSSRDETEPESGFEQLDFPF